MIEGSAHLKMAPNRGARLVKGILVGALVGVAATLVAPKTYVAEVSLLFPTINASALKEVTKSLKLDGAGVDWNKSTSTSDAQMVEAASLVFKSRAAITSALKEAKVTLSPTVLALQGDPIEYFRNRNVDIDASDASIRLKVSYTRPETARALCQGLLDYYTTFVHEHRLTNTARTRLQLEEKLVRVDRRLSVLERKLALSPEGRFPQLADGTVRPDSKVVRELWKQRILEGGSSGRILDEMRKIRKEAGQDAEPPETDIAEDWRSRWGSTTLEDAASREASLPRSGRRADLPSRLELERVYEETLLLYHAGLLQYDFLSMWEGLENFDFELVDPVAVHQEASTDRMLTWAVFGAIIGGLLMWGSTRPS